MTDPTPEQIEAVARAIEPVLHRHAMAVVSGKGHDFDLAVELARALSSTDQREEERERIVAWLRSPQGKGSEEGVDWADGFADAIERGDHLPSPPVGDEGDG